MKPALAFPYNDPDGTMLPHIQAILPDLKNHFDHAYVSAPPSSFELLQQNNLIHADSFFTVFPVAEDKLVGEHFAHLYQRAAETAPSDQPLHLCYPDRVAFALEGEHRASFLADVDSLSTNDLPLIFQRSQAAWETTTLKTTANSRELSQRLDNISSAKNWIMASRIRTPQEVPAQQVAADRCGIGAAVGPTGCP